MTIEINKEFYFIEIRDCLYEDDPIEHKHLPTHDGQLAAYEAGLGGMRGTGELVWMDTLTKESAFNRG